MRVGGYASPSGVSGNTGVIEPGVDEKGKDVSKNPTQADGLKSADTANQQSGSTTKRSEIEFAGQSRAAELSKELAKTPASKNRIFADGVTDPEKVAGSKKYTDAEKTEFYKNYMTNAGADDFKKLIDDSGKWPNDKRALLDNALATPEVAKRAAIELGRGQHLDTLDRIFRANSGNSYKAVREYISNLDTPSLNHVTEHLKELENLESPDVKGRMMNASAVLRGLAERSGELTREARLELTQQTLRIQLDSLKDKYAEVEQAYTLGTIFSNSSPEQKNQLFDDLQDRGKIDDLAASLKEMKEIDVNVLNGLNAQNVDALRETFKQLAKESKDVNKKDDTHTYERLILQLNGWMENHFPEYRSKS
ncbi:MAG TPA: hypothetical protein VLH08_19235 [Acidobacteriota bacterium]|nr:hypothetical protein [Acidobacteriota bacterium]